MFAGEGASPESDFVTEGRSLTSERRRDKGKIIMNYKTFTYRVPPPENPEDLNTFLDGNKILSVWREFVTNDRSTYLVFTVCYLKSSPSEKKVRNRIDYREVLSETDFSAYSRLRDLRKTLADQEGVPVYTVFTNAHLAEMVKKKVTTIEDIRSIEGVGAPRVEKFGREFLSLCRQIFETSKKDQAG